jgi:uncharacterized membrane protein YsdA (DUF1294 family)
VIAYLYYNLKRGDYQMVTWLFYYIGAINLIALTLMCLDKRKAVTGKWRISEFTLLGIGIIGGAFGILSGMVICKHKLSKLRFRMMMPVAGVIHWTVIGYFGLFWKS